MADDKDPQPLPKARRVHFGRARGPRLMPEAAARQGLVTKLAFEALGGKDAAVQYLNLENAGLGGRPLDIATASTEGLTRVRLDIAGRGVAPRANVRTDT